MTLDQLYDKWVDAINAEDDCLSDNARKLAEAKSLRYYNLMRDEFEYSYQFHTFLTDKLPKTFKA